MGERKPSLIEVPDDFEVYKLCFVLHKLPDEVRAMSLDDRMWLIDIPIAEVEAAAELKRRGSGKD